MEKINLEYYQENKFWFTITEKTEGFLKGFFQWNIETKNEIERITTLIEIAEEFWYLDDNGYRIDDEKLFEKSPWAIVSKTDRHKIVQRYINYNTGEAWFATTPWFRIGEVYNEQ